MLHLPRHCKIYRLFVGRHPASLVNTIFADSAGNSHWRLFSLSHLTFLEASAACHRVNIIFTLFNHFSACIPHFTPHPLPLPRPLATSPPPPFPLTCTTLHSHSPTSPYTASHHAVCFQAVHVSMYQFLVKFATVT